MLLSFQPVTRERRKEVTEELDQAGSLTTDYLVLVALSCVIATFGLLQNSAAVIIGAMLIAPLMSPIARGSLAVVRGDLRRGWRSLGTLAVGILLAIALSALFGLFTVSGVANLQEQLPSEIVARTQPNLLDLAVALAGGAIVAYALARKELSATLPGVAIATALMPPLCTLGIGIALRQSEVSGGAFLLFIVNFAAIVLSSSLVFVVMGFRPKDVRRTRVPVRWVLAIEVAVVLVILIPLTRLTLDVLHQVQQNVVIRTTLSQELAQDGGATLADFSTTQKPGYVEIVATVRTPHDLPYPTAVAMQRTLAERLQETVALKLLIVPVTILDPLVPPTPTPTVTPHPTATPVPTATATP